MLVNIATTFMQVRNMSNGSTLTGSRPASGKALLPESRTRGAASKIPSVAQASESEASEPAAAAIKAKPSFTSRRSQGWNNSDDDV